MTETKISCTEAHDKHGVTCEHGRMSNGELRFRLKKNDGTAYIRTESPQEGGWQCAHYHNKVKETYIVQTGRIGYAELVGEDQNFYVYEENEIFTTKPIIIHNIYMFPGAVIHTVKHGDSFGEERLVDEKTKQFTKLTKLVSEAELISRSSSTRKGQADGDYSEAYRHFDNLIWQVAAWSIGIFTIVFGSMSQLTAINPLPSVIGLSFRVTYACLFLVFCIFICVLSYALYRFRWHQIRLKNYTPKDHLRSPQVGLQLMVDLQAEFLAVPALILFGISVRAAMAIATFALCCIVFSQESELYKLGKTGSKPTSTRS